MSNDQTSRTIQADEVLDRSQNLLQQGKDVEGMALAKEGLGIHESVGNKGGIGRAHNILGIASMNVGDFPAAFEHYRFALEVSIELGQRGRISSTLHNIGMVLQHTGDYPEALDHYYRAQEINEEIGETHHLANNLLAMGTVLVSMNERTSAIEVFERAMANYQELGMMGDVAMCLSNLGGIYDQMGDLERALEFHRRAADIYKTNEDDPAALDNLISIAKCLIKLDRIQEALTYRDLVTSYQTDRPIQRLAVMDLLAMIHIASNELDPAAANYQQALEESESLGMRDFEVQIHKHLRDLALKRNDLASYVAHNDAFTKINEELHGKEATTRIAMQKKEREFESREREFQKQLAVLHSTLPKDVADRVARGEVVNDHYDNASVLFLDIVGFTELSSTMSSAEVISLLDDVFSQCDAICAKHGITKIKTIGDSYLAFGIANSEQRIANAEQRIANSEQRIANAALEMMKIELNDALKKTLEKALHKPLDEALIKFRIGIHTGPVTAGVIGKERFQYDVWGDTVNIASRMESTSEPGRIHVTEELAQRCGHPCIPREAIDVKGRGMMQTFWIAQ